jgi:SAM domain (Sterile alpha motif)
VLTDEDLIEIGIKKKGHRLILLNAVKDEYFTSLAPNPSFYYSYVSFIQTRGGGVRALWGDRAMVTR